MFFFFPVHIKTLHVYRFNLGKYDIKVKIKEALINSIFMSCIHAWLSQHLHGLNLINEVFEL